MGNAVEFTEEKKTEVDQKLKSVEAINQDRTLYERARFAALLDDEIACEGYLTKALRYGSIPIGTDLMEDPDFRRFNDKYWFREITIGVPK